MERMKLAAGNQGGCGSDHQSVISPASFNDSPGYQIGLCPRPFDQALFPYTIQLLLALCDPIALLGLIE